MLGGVIVGVVDVDMGMWCLLRFVCGVKLDDWK